MSEGSYPRRNGPSVAEIQQMAEEIRNRSEQMRPAPERESLLEEAARRIREGDEAYGKARVVFTQIAEILTALGYRKAQQQITPVDVVIIQEALKLCRIAHNPVYRDSWADVAGYAVLGHEMALSAEPDYDI